MGFFIYKNFVTKSKQFSFNSMKVVNPRNISHNITLITRFLPVGTLSFNLYNEATKEENTISISENGISFNDFYILDNGYTFLIFDFSFEKNQRFRITLTDSNENILYRGKLLAIIEETQNYQTDNEEYYYE